MAQAKSNREKAIEQYNRIMFLICEEYNTIGTRFTETPDDRNKWTIRDMVSEMQYCIDKYKDPFCIYWQDAHDDSQPSDKPWYKAWRNELGMMTRFVKRWESVALAENCTSKHCSKYDN